MIGQCFEAERGIERILVKAVPQVVISLLGVRHLGCTFKDVVAGVAQLSRVHQVITLCHMARAAEGLDRVEIHAAVTAVAVIRRNHKALVFCRACGVQPAAVGIPAIN